MGTCINLANELGDTLKLPSYLHILAIILFKCWQGTVDIGCILFFIHVCEAAVGIAQTDPILSMLYDFLAKSFSNLYFLSHDENSSLILHEFSMVEDVYCALYYYRASVALSATPARQLKTAMVWASFAMSLNLDETLTAYSSALATLPNILWIGNSRRAPQFPNKIECARFGFLCCDSCSKVQ
jgi:energy-converting hydrogenase Eha subunit E